MIFTPVDSETMQVQVSGDETFALLMNSGEEDMTEDKARQYVVSAVLRLQDEKIGYETTADKVGVVLCDAKDLGFVMQIHGYDIYDLNEDEPFDITVDFDDVKADASEIREAAPPARSEDNQTADSDSGQQELPPEEKQQEMFRRDNILYRRGLSLPFDSMEQVIACCKHLLTKRVTGSQLYSMDGNYFLIVQISPICEETGEQQIMDCMDIAKLDLVFREFVPHKPGSLQRLDAIQEHGQVLLKENAVGFLAGIDQAVG